MLIQALEALRKKKPKSYWVFRELLENPLPRLSGFRREEIRLRINELVPDEPIAQLTFRLGGTGQA